MKKIAVIGNFGILSHPVADGQTIKTRIVTEELQRQFGVDEVLIINTHGGIKNLFKSPFQCLRALFNALNIIVFPAHNGVRVYVPMLSLLKYFFRTSKLHYVVIGGWLPSFITNRPILKRSLRCFGGIYVETNTMKEALGQQGYDNVFIMPNFKQLAIVKENDLHMEFCEPYKLCTFSRVMKEKGVGTAVDVVRTINSKYGRTVYKLDIYGKIEPTQTEWFNQLQQDFPEYVKYCGVVDFNKSVETLKDYFALLFPTYYAGEGFAGTIIDAYAAGVPVIASDWRYNSDIISDGYTGYVYATNKNTCLQILLEDIMQNPQKIIKMRSHCISRAEDYLPMNAIQSLIGNLIDINYKG